MHDKPYECIAAANQPGNHGQHTANAHNNPEANTTNQATNDTRECTLSQRIVLCTTESSHKGISSFAVMFLFAIALKNITLELPSA
jgi:hypothetical protein